MQQKQIPSDRNQNAKINSMSKGPDKYKKLGNKQVYMTEPPQKLEYVINKCHGRKNCKTRDSCKSFLFYLFSKFRMMLTKSSYNI